MPNNGITGIADAPLAAGRRPGMLAVVRRRWAGLGGAALLLLLLSGCVWRTREADHVFGPSFFRTNRTAPGRPEVVQTFHIPLLLEGGRQWGLSLGCIGRVAVVPARWTRSGAASNPPAASPHGLFLHGDAGDGEWHFSPLYYQAPLRETPLLIRRSVVGVQAAGGTEQRAVSVGYSATTLTLPRQDALHALEFDSRQPLAARAVVVPVAEVGSGSFPTLSSPNPTPTPTPTPKDSL